MIAPEMPSEPGTISTSTIVIVPVQKAFSLFTRRSPKTDFPRIQAKGDTARRVRGCADQSVAKCVHPMVNRHNRSHLDALTKYLPGKAFALGG
jgi:hypothetical protein